MLRHNRPVMKVLSVIVAMMVLCSCFPVFSLNNVFANEGDEVTIQSFTAEVHGGATLESGKYVYTPYSMNSGHEFVYRLSYQFSGIGSLPVDSVEIRIPLHIFKNRNDVWDDNFMLPIPRDTRRPGDTSVQYSEDVTFVYTVDRENEQILIHNVRELDAGAEGHIDVAYRNASVVTNYVDMRASEPFEAVVEITKNNQTYSSTATAEPFYINTNTYAESQYVLPSSGMADQLVTMAIATLVFMTSSCYILYICRKKRSEGMKK